MAAIIRIKRSATSGNPSTLAAGELAYSGLGNNDVNGGDRLYIGMGTETNGNAANHVIIGGKYFTDLMDHSRGTLTADSAIITDSDSKIDNLLVDNLQLNGNTLSSTDENGDINITPNGTGLTKVKNLSATGIVNDSLTAGRVVYVSSNKTLVDTANFAWDNANNTLIIDGIAKLGNVRVAGNTISTTNDDGNLIIAPLKTNSDTTASQAIVKIDNVRGLVIPVGTTSQRPTDPETGLIRYNSTNSQFEGYNGTSYISIGGVRDVDGNTYIIPESAPGMNENILYFYNDGVLGMTLSKTELELKSTVTAKFSNTTESTTTGTGAVVVAGGVGIAKQLIVGGDTSKFTATTTSTSKTTGAVVVTGGVGVGENLNVGGNATITGSLTVASDGAPSAVNIEASTLNLQSHQNATVGLSTNSATSYTLTIDAVNSGTGGADLDVNVKNGFTLDAASISIDSTDTTNITMSANNAANKTLLIDASNSGLGAAIIEIGSSDTDFVNITSSDTVTVDANTHTVNAASDINLNAVTINLSTDSNDASDEVTITSLQTTINSDTINLHGKDGVSDCTINLTGQINVGNIKLDGNTISTTDTSNVLYLDPAPTAEPNQNQGTVVIRGDLQVDGTTTTVNSTVVTIEDPIFTLGGTTAPTEVDTLDRGIEFQWYDTSAKVGFFGYDNSAAEFIFVPDATDSSSVISGTLGNAAFGQLRLTSTTDSSSTTTGALRVAGGVGIDKKLYVGGVANFTSTTNSSSVSTGSMVVAGGVGIAKTVYVGDDLIGAGADTSNLDGFNIDGGTY